MLLFQLFFTPILVVLAWFFHREFRTVCQIRDPFLRESACVYWNALLSLGGTECLLQYIVAVWETLEGHEYGLWTIHFLQLVVVMYFVAKILNRGDCIREYRSKCLEGSVQYRE